MARIVGGNLGINRGFSSAVSKWTKATEERATEAFQMGSLDFFLALRDATPVDTGLLRSSLIAGKNGEVAAGPPNLADSTSGDLAALGVFSSLKLGDKITMVYRTTYAMRVNYGFVGFDSLGRYFNQAGRHWVEAVSAKYVSIMRRAASRLKK